MPELQPAIPLIPRSILFGNPTRATPRVSPDGKLLAYLAPNEADVLQVWVRTLGQNDDRAVTADPKRGIRQFSWCYSPNVLLYLQDDGGNEDFHLHAVDLATGADRDLTPFPGVRAQVAGIEPGHPDTVLVGLNKENPALHDIYRLQLPTGELTLDTRNTGAVVGWVADADLNVVAAQASRPDGGFEVLVRDSADGEWRRRTGWGQDEEGALVGLSLDGRSLYIKSSVGANTARLLVLEVEGAAEAILAADPNYDAGSCLFHPTLRHPQAVSFNRDRRTWHVLDPELEPALAALRALGDAEISIESRDEADKWWTVGLAVDRGPTQYYLFHRPTGAATPLFSSQPELEGLPLAAMEPVEILARDGLKLHAYLTVPVDAVRPVPAVLLVHGGPWTRDSWGYSPTVQWLANRGYAVLQVNYRGSTGYGKAFTHAGDREWAGRMHDDLIDATDWLIREGIADKQRVAIMGGSYGGYATLVGLTFTPEVFAAGVDIVGPSNLKTLMETIPPYWAPMLDWFQARVGAKDDDEFLRLRSPLWKAHRIVRPLLIGQGANDPRVKQSESEQIVAAMRQAELPVEDRVYQDEGHGFARPENRLHFFARAEAFLTAHLGGRCEPEGELTGHSGAAG